jgi:hypothetical protein
MKFNDGIQWIGATLIIVGHVLNAIGPSMYPYNIIVFALGTITFLTWAYRVNNKPQLVVNVVSLAIGIIGLTNAIIT